MSDLKTVGDYEQRTKEIVAPGSWEGFHFNNFNEVTHHRTTPALDSVLLRPRVLGNVSDPDTSTTILGEKISLPVITASPGSHMHAHPEGEVATAQGADMAGTLTMLSSHSNYSLEDVAAAADKKWGQIYIYPDREFIKETIQRVEDSGYSALTITVDVPIMTKWGTWSTRQRYQRDPTPSPNLMRLSEDGTRKKITESFDPSITWDIVRWAREITSLPIVIKGILTAEDALLAKQYEVQGVVVSNHGAHIMDGSLTSIEALSEIVDAVEGKVEVYIDGGIRTGLEVLKTLALGARACLIGKPLFYGLAVDGADGVADIFRILQKELASAMAACGVNTVDEIDRSLVMTPDLSFFPPLPNQRG